MVEISVASLSLIYTLPSFNRHIIFYETMAEPAKSILVRRIKVSTKQMEKGTCTLTQTRKMGASCLRIQENFSLVFLPEIK